MNIIIRYNLRFKPISFALALYSKAIVADSFITVPKFPVIVITPLPGEIKDSKEYHHLH
jgi:hypothetical protein